jgi:hypothetical protein
MPGFREEGSIPQGLIEQARAKNVDPGKLQLLGKQAAALYSEGGTSLTDAVVNVIGKEDLGPEHARRICEFANQAAFQNEWEKGGSVRNIEFEGGPADPAVVLREMNDGARPETLRISDYDEPPQKLARADRRVEEEIFGKFATPNFPPHPSDVPPGMPDLHRLRTTLDGAQDHVHSQMSKAATEKEVLAGRLADEACKVILSGASLYKIGCAWSSFPCAKEDFKEAMSATIQRLRERNIPYSVEPEKNAEVGHIPNQSHPVIKLFLEFAKVAAQHRILSDAGESLKQQQLGVEEVIKEGAANIRELPAPKAGLGFGTLAAARAMNFRRNS